MSEESEQLYEQGLALEPEARAAYIENACRRDPQLCEELVSLLARAEAADEFFDLLTDAVFSTPFPVDEGPDRRLRFTSPDLAVGQTIGHYRILSLIGTGGMGTVYRAHDTRLDRDVALKFLPPHLRLQPDGEERLLAEARAAAGLEHRNVCSIHEIGETGDGRRFIAMAYYEGETLKERLVPGPLSIEEAVAIAVRIGRGLAAAHARGIVHRDVKPANVILGADGTVRLLDFGLAMLADASHIRSGMTPGTVAYMSPEQGRGDPVDRRTDLWSLGVVLYEMLAGQRPFRGSNYGQIIQAILHEDPEPIAKRRPGVPAPLARIVERLLHKDPGGRYGTATELLADLARVLPSAATPPQPSIVAKRRGLLLAGSTTALVALVGAALWLPPSRGEPEPAASTAGGTAAALAVLPLENLGADPRDAALADGMTEELIAMLARTEGLRVIASTSTFALRGRQGDVRRIADSLGVSHILVGGFQRTDSRLRVQVRLANARDGSTRWSHTYEREFEDVYSVQDEIARAVAGELDLRLTGGANRQALRHYTRNIAAYELYLRGSDLTLTRSDSGVREALGYFQQAIAADSMYAPAYAGLAGRYVRMGWNRDPGRPLRELHALADEAARKAIALDDSLAEAHWALGRVRLAEFDFDFAEIELRRAVALDPTEARIRAPLVELYLWTGRSAEALAEARRAREVDPLNPHPYARIAGALFANRRSDEALAQLDRIAGVRPPPLEVALLTGRYYIEKEMWPEAIAALRPQAETGEPVTLALLGYALARAGQRDEANRILADLLARRLRIGVGAFEVAMVYAGLGDLDQAFVWLDRSVDDRSLKYVIMEPTFDELREDPRFERLEKRLGLQTGERSANWSWKADSVFSVVHSGQLPSKRKTGWETSGGPGDLREEGVIPQGRKN